MYLELILTVLVVVTGIAWLFFRKNSKGILKEIASFFPILLIVFVVRSFVFEPFRIPSGSMLPTLYLGDFIAVKKYSYGIRLPVINKKIIDTGEPERGDIVVFRFPENPKIYYIKRLIGLPGDEIELSAHQIKVNGKVLELEDDGVFNGEDAGDSKLTDIKQYVETIDNVEHAVLHEPRDVRLNSGENVIINVPEGKYFMMGDNRDHSSDSRFWGFVPDELLVGKAVRIWMSLYEWDVRWERIGDKLL